MQDDFQIQKEHNICVFADDESGAVAVAPSSLMSVAAAAAAALATAAAPLVRVLSANSPTRCRKKIKHNILDISTYNYAGW